MARLTAVIRQRLRGRRTPPPPAQAPKKPARDPARARSVLGVHAPLVPKWPGAAIVVLAHPDLRHEVPAWLSVFAGRRRVVIATEAAPEWNLEADGIRFLRARTLAGMSQQIRLVGPVGAIINTLPDNLLPQEAESHLDMWRRLFFHLRPRGAYVIDRRFERAEGLGDLQRSLMQLIAAVGDPAHADASSKPDAQAVRAIGSVTVTRDFIVVTKRHKHYALLRDAETTPALLSSREPAVTVETLETTAPGEVVTGAEITTHVTTRPIYHLDRQLGFPALHLRHYTGPLTLAGWSVLRSNHTILPDSFRHHLEEDLKHPRMEFATHEFATLPADMNACEHLDGHYYFLDSTFSGHFGHLMTEVIARLWGWDRAKQLDPALKAIYLVRPGQRMPRGLEDRIFQAYGIAGEDIVWRNRPVTVDSVVAATPMWHNKVPYYVHPAMQETWDRIGSHLVDPAAPAIDKVFVSRGSTISRRSCRNIREVEELFTANGFQIFYPEEHDLGVQAGVFAQAHAIAGFAGSAMYNMMFAKKMRTLILLGHEEYSARNEHLFTMLTGGDVHYFWSTPDVTPESGGWSQAAYESSWEFDFDRYRDELTALLTTL